MVSAVIMAGVSVVIFGIYLFMKKASSYEDDYERKPGTGKVVKWIHEDGRDTYYVIAFSDGVKQYTAHSTYYAVTHRKYHEDDTVKILYAFMENGNPLVDIDDAELITRRSISKNRVKWFLVASIAMMVLAVITMITAVI